MCIFKPVLTFSIFDILFVHNAIVVKLWDFPKVHYDMLACNFMGRDLLFY